MSAGKKDCVHIESITKTKGLMIKYNKIMSMPDYINKYFWEGQYSVFNKDQYSHVISRLLDLGDEQAINWLFKNFSKIDIVVALKSSREISKKSANYWGNYFGISKEEITCLRNPLTAKQEKIWKY
jgi:hypothetical protein